MREPIIDYDVIQKCVAHALSSVGGPNKYLYLAFDQSGTLRDIVGSQEPEGIDLYDGDNEIRARFYLKLGSDQ